MHDYFKFNAIDSLLKVGAGSCLPLCYINSPFKNL